MSAGAALIETDMKRIIAYSTISQIGFIFLGLSVGHRRSAIAGGLLYILMHGIAKGGLFLCAGIIEHQTHTKDITKMGGLAAKMPLTAFAFLFCSFSVMGVPPFGGFFSKYLVFAGAFSSGQTAIGLVFLVGAFMTIIYLFRLFTRSSLGEDEDPGRRARAARAWSGASSSSPSFRSPAASSSAIPSAFVQTAVVAMSRRCAMNPALLLLPILIPASRPRLPPRTGPARSMVKEWPSPSSRRPPSSLVAIFLFGKEAESLLSLGRGLGHLLLLAGSIISRASSSSPPRASAS